MESGPHYKTQEIHQKVACLLPPLYLFQVLHRFCCFLPSQLLSTTPPSVLYIRSPLFFLQAPTPTLTSSPQPFLEGARSQDDSPAPLMDSPEQPGLCRFSKTRGAHQGVSLKYDQAHARGGLELRLGLGLKAQCFCHDDPTTTGQYVNDTFLPGSLVPERSASSSC